MSKMYTLDNKLLVGVPEIRIGNEIIKVDYREKTVKKILKLVDNHEGDSGELADGVLKLALDAKDFKKISEMNLPWPAYSKLMTLIMAAATGEEPEEIEERFQEPEE